jgi:hypothetical protein
MDARKLQVVSYNPISYQFETNGAMVNMKNVADKNTEHRKTTHAQQASKYSLLFSVKICNAVTGEDVTFSF